MDLKALALALRAPEQNVATNWPPIEAALLSLGVSSRLAIIGALATIRVECPPFAPRSEQYNGDPQEYFRRYDGRRDLGNTEPGDGFRFRGRGYVQITGRYNYGHYSKLIGVDLLAEPDAALNPHNAAAIFAHFYAARHVAEAAEREDWPEVRRLVNGGNNGLSLLEAIVGHIKKLL